ncbi:replication-relaxation family protein [bacterium]|nr:replication-relaxation family protein [bacterium]
MKLQPDDLLILELLAQHRLVTSRQLFLAVAGDRNARAFSYRLRRLFDAEFVSRPRHQMLPGEPAKPFAYALGVNGHRHLYPAQWNSPNGHPRDWRQRDRRIRPQAIAHEVQLTEFLLALRLAAEAQDWTFRWSLGDAFRAETGFARIVEIEPAYGSALTLPLNPDAFVTIDTGEHRYRWFVETDMGTEPAERNDLRRSSVRQKLLAYWQLNQSVLRRYDRRTDSFKVFFLTTTEERLHGLRAAAQQADEKKKGSHFFMFSTHARTSMEAADSLLTDHVWWTARAGYDNPRTLFLSPCARCSQLLDPSNEPYESFDSDPRLVLAPASTPLPDILPTEELRYAHTDCPALRANGRAR